MNNDMESKRRNNILSSNLPTVPSGEMGHCRFLFMMAIKNLANVIKRATMCQERSDGCVLGMIGWMCARRDHPPVYPNGMGR
jgi:hypothetical protein